MNVLLTLLSLLNVIPVIAAWGFTGLVVAICGLIALVMTIGKAKQVKWNVWVGILGTTASILAFSAPLIALLIGLTNLTIILVPEKI